MEKNYEMYKVYANVAYTWYQGNSNLKKATQVMMGVMMIFYFVILWSLYNIFQDSNNFIVYFSLLFMVITGIGLYFLKGMVHLIDVCRELEKQEDFWTKNNKTFAQKPDGLSKKEELIFNAVQEVIKSKVEVQTPNQIYESKK